MNKIKELKEATDLDLENGSSNKQTIDPNKSN